MIRRLFIPWICSIVALHAATGRDDLLRFNNGDQLHGNFLGIKDGPKVIWKRDDLGKPIDFDMTRARHVVLHGGRPDKAVTTLCHVVLVNGDRIPGEITASDDGFFNVETAFAGVLKVPRDQVSMLAPNPLGGRVYYHGPFSEDEWISKHGSFPEGMPPVPDAADAKTDGDTEESEDAKQPGRWTFSAASWYWMEKKAGTAIIRESGMEDRAVLRFSLAWKNRLSLAVGFHSDFFRPEPAKDEEDEPNARPLVPGDSAYLPSLFGNSYVLQLYSNYLVLYRSTFDEEGKPSVRRVELNNSNFRLGDSGKADVEIRSDRRSGAIALFIDDEYIAQWSEKSLLDGENVDFAGKGAGFGFVVQSESCSVRISDIMVSEWNGMPDSARSLQLADQDIVLMANGTDRYAGRVGALDGQGKLHFEGRHGDFTFPLDEVAEIRFASDRLAEPSDEPADQIIVRMSPIGVISGRPTTGDDSVLGLVNPVVGEVHVSLESAVMLDFNSSNNIIDDWDADF